MVQPLWKAVWQFLKKLNILLPYNPEFMLIGIYPKELKIYGYTKTWTRRFIAAFIITDKTWKQPRCLSVGERINCGLNNGILFSIIKKVIF